MARIAVVEDNADNRMLLRAMLGQAFEVSAFDDGSAALAAFAASRPDLVVLDISLPGMNGLEILATMRADRGLAAVPVIALTAHAMSGDREKYLAAGFDDYVTKPIVDEAILFGAIDRLLNVVG
jgi:two-component system, cell cycle response regulator DivK